MGVKTLKWGQNTEMGIQCQTFQLCDLKMREILVIVIYKGGGAWRHSPPGKFFQTEMSFTAFSKKINVFLRLQNTIKVSNVTLFTSAQRQLCVLFCQKTRYFSSPSTFAFFRPKPIEVVPIVIRILQLCLITAYTQIAAHLEFRF